MCEDTDGGKRMQQEPTDRKEEAAEREMGNFSPSLEDVFDPWIDIQSSCLPSQDG